MHVQPCMHNTALEAYESLAGLSVSRSPDGVGIEFHLKDPLAFTV